MGYTLLTRRTPNVSARSGAPEFFVMHVTEGSFDGSVSWLCNPAAQASADEVVSLDGKRVAVLNTAASRLKTWAVGNGNSQSMSWENEGHAGQTHWPRAHYDTLADRLVRAQKAVRRTYGVTIPLRRTLSPQRRGICGHGDMARWFGGSDHYGCPGPTFSFSELEAAIARRTTLAGAFKANAKYVWANWLLTAPKARGKQPPHPRRIPKDWWRAVRWMKRQRAKAAAERKARATFAEWILTPPAQRGPKPPTPTPIPKAYWQAVTALREQREKAAS